MGKKLHMLALPLAAAALAALASPAQAAEGYDRCQEGYYCLFSGLDGTGDIVQLKGSTPDLAALGMADRAKSDWNRTDNRIYLYSEANYEGCTAVTFARDKGNFFIDYRDFWDSVGFNGPGGMSCSPPPGEGFAKQATPDSHG